MFEEHAGLWSFISAASSLTYTVVAAAGLVFIWLQLRASRHAISASSMSAQAAAEAAKIAYSASRPWLKFSVEKAYIYLGPERVDSVGCQINVSIENIGNTPAIDVRVVYKPVPAGYQIPLDIPGELEALKAAKVRDPRVLFPRDKIQEGRSQNFPFPRQLNEDMMGFKIVAAVFYRAAADGEMYWTPLVLETQHEMPPADKVYRFYRGMGHVPCIVMRIGDQTPPPT